jgi:hypothetical protein
LDCGIDCDSGRIEGKEKSSYRRLEARCDGGGQGLAPQYTVAEAAAKKSTTRSKHAAGKNQPERCAGQAGPPSGSQREVAEGGAVLGHDCARRGVAVLGFIEKNRGERSMIRPAGSFTPREDME